MCMLFRTLIFSYPSPPPPPPDTRARARGARDAGEAVGDLNLHVILCDKEKKTVTVFVLRCKYSRIPGTISVTWQNRPGVLGTLIYEGVKLERGGRLV
jgi:hypothetical protein